MSNLFIILFLISLILFIVGLIKPRAVIKWGEKRTRGRSSLIYGVLAIIFFIGVGATGSNSSSTPAVASTSNTSSSNSTSSSSTNTSNTDSSNTTSDASNTTTQNTSNSTPATPLPSQPDSSKQVTFISAFPAIDSSANITVDPSSVNYVKAHPTWFPASSSNTSYESAINHSLTEAEIMKDPTSYYQTLYQNTGSVEEIHQYHNPDYAMVQIVIDSGSDSGSQALVMYEGNTGSIVQGSEVQFVGLPVCEYDFSNVSGGTTQSVLFDGVKLVQTSSGQ